MKIKDGFVLKQLGDSFIVVPVNSRVVDFASIIKLNDTGAFLWSMLESDQTTDSLLSAMLSDYDVSEALAVEHIDKFINKLREHDILE